MFYYAVAVDTENVRNYLVANSDQEIDLTISSNGEGVYNEKRKLDYGLNFIENNLYGL